MEVEHGSDEHLATWPCKAHQHVRLKEAFAIGAKISCAGTNSLILSENEIIMSVETCILLTFMLDCAKEYICLS